MRLIVGCSTLFGIFCYLCGMKTSKITVRSARREDAELIAEAVCMAVGYDKSHPLYPVFLNLARRKNTQYSYCNALIGEVDGTVAGAIMGYDGALLHKLRRPIYPLLEKHLGAIPHIEDETEAGEFYLDSLGVRPEFRGMGIGEALLNALCDKAFAEGYKQAGLLVDFDNPNAERLYTSIGFRRVGTKKFLGHDMWHLQRTSTMDIHERVERATFITPFERRLYKELLRVPRGTTITYGELAKRIGCRSAQAVGQALRRNPFAPEVPCHRVVAADGSLGGFNGKREGEQIERKRALLAEEGCTIATR